jgi:hypothetical protein
MWYFVLIPIQDFSLHMSCYFVLVPSQDFFVCELLSLIIKTKVFLPQAKTKVFLPQASVILDVYGYSVDAF